MQIHLWVFLHSLRWRSDKIEAAKSVGCLGVDVHVLECRRWKVINTLLLLVLEGLLVKHEELLLMFL